MDVGVDEAGQDGAAGKVVAFRGVFSLKGGSLAYGGEDFAAHADGRALDNGLAIEHTVGGAEKVAHGWSPSSTSSTRCDRLSPWYADSPGSWTRPTTLPPGATCCCPIQFLESPPFGGRQLTLENDALPEIRVDPDTYRVWVDGALLTSEPAKVLPMAQRYFLFCSGPSGSSR
jgi:hypothetical protein